VVMVGHEAVGVANQVVAFISVLEGCFALAAQATRENRGVHDRVYQSVQTNPRAISGKPQGKEKAPAIWVPFVV